MTAARGVLNRLLNVVSDARLTMLSIAGPLGVKIEVAVASFSSRLPNHWVRRSRALAEPERDFWLHHLTCGVSYHRNELGVAFESRAWFLL